MDLNALSKEDLLALKGELETDLGGSDEFSQFSKEQLLSLKSQLETDLMESEAGPEEEDTGSFIENLPRYAAQGARHLAAGVGDIPDLVYAPKNLYEIGKHSLNKYRANEGEEVAPPEFSTFGLGDKVAHGIDELTGGYTAPKTDGERAFETVGRAISSSVGTGGIGGASVQGANALSKVGKAAKLAKVLEKGGKGLQIGNTPTLPNLAGTGAGSYVMHNVLEAEPDNYLGAIGSSAVAGMLGQGAGKLSSNLLKGDLRNQSLRTAGKALGMKEKNIKNLKDAEITPTVAATSDYEIIKHGENAASKLWKAGEPLEKIYKERPGEFLKSLEIEKGKKLSKEQIGHKAKEALGNVENHAEAEIERLHTKAFENLGLPDADELKALRRAHPSVAAAADKIRKDKININPTIQKLEDMLDSLETASEKKEFYKAPVGKYLKRLRNSSKGGEIPFRSLDNIRKDLGAKTKPSFGLITDHEKGPLKYAYGLLAEDINTHFENLGGKALDHWNEYKNYYKNYKELEVPHMNKLLKEGKKDASEIFNSFYTDLEHGGKRLKQVAKGMSPNETKEVFDALTLHMGMNAEGEFSPNMWAKKVIGLEPEVQKIYTDLASSSPGVQKKFPALVEAAKNIKERSNTSGTAIHNVIYGYFTDAGRVLTGDLTAAVKPIGGWLLAWGANKGIMANPNFIDAVYKAQTIKHKGQIPILLKSMEKIPGMPEKVIKQARQVYRNSRKMTKIDQHISGVGVKGSAKKAIMTSIMESSKGPHKKVHQDNEHKDNWRLSPDKKYWIAKDKTDEEYYKDQGQGFAP